MDNGTPISDLKLESEMVGGEPYEYYPLGEYVVRAPGVCGGRPTFKYTRIDVSFILGRIATGSTVDEIVTNYHNPNLTIDAIQEAMTLAKEAFIVSPLATQALFA